MNRSPILGIVAAGVLVLAAGCGDDMGLTQVSGTVTLDGKPVPNATVTFTPQADAAATPQTGAPQEATPISPSYGTTDAEGYYTLMFSRDREGVLPGAHDVTIETEKMAPSDVKALKAEGQEVPEFVPVPLKYSVPGELERNVEPEGGEINFELTSEGSGPRQG